MTAVINIVEVPGNRLINGSDINTIIDAVNSLASGTTSGAFKGTFIANTGGAVPIQIGSTASAALALGSGTSATPFAMGTTAGKNMIGVWGDTTATTGDSRLAYLRLYFSGAGVSGEAARIFGTVNNVTAAVGGTVNGAHISLTVAGASGAISGAGNAVRATLGLGASVNPGGTLAVMQVDSDLDNAATVPATLSYLRFTNSNTKKVPIFANLDGVDTSTLYVAAGTGSGSAGNSTHCAAQQVLRINVNGAAAYIPVFTQNS